MSDLRIFLELFFRVIFSLMVLFFIPGLSIYYFEGSALAGLYCVTMVMTIAITNLCSWLYKMPTYLDCIFETKPTPVNPIKYSIGRK